MSVNIMKKNNARYVNVLYRIAWDKTGTSSGRSARSKFKRKSLFGINGTRHQITSGGVHLKCIPAPVSPVEDRLQERVVHNPFPWYRK